MKRREWLVKGKSQRGTIALDGTAGEVTQLLNELEGRNQEATPRLFELLYNELRKLAQYYLKSERPDHTLQATALVHEAYVRLVGATALAEPDTFFRNCFERDAAGVGRSGAG